MGNINNAITSKKTTIGAIGVIVAAIGAACQHFGDGSMDTVGLLMEILGTIKLAYGLLNARDNDVTSADAGAYGDLAKPKTGGYVNLRLLAGLSVFVALLAAFGCVGLRRGLTDVGKRMLIPTTEQGVLTDLKLVEDDILVQTAQKDRLTVARDAIANAAVEYKFDADKALAATDALLAEVDKNLEYLAERKKLLDAAKSVYDARHARESDALPPADATPPLAEPIPPAETSSAPVTPLSFPWRSIDGPPLETWSIPRDTVESRNVA